VRSIKTLALVILALGLANPVWGGNGCGPLSPPCPRIPEIDPGFAQSALTLLVGGVLMLRGRRRR